MRFRVTRSGWKLMGALLSVAWIAACAGAPLGATDANLAQANDQAAQGARAYAANCAGCHGERGQGKRAPSIMGAGALPEYPNESQNQSAYTDPQVLQEEARNRPAGAPSREPFKNAGDLYNYVSKRMPMPDAKAGTLSADEYWAIVNFMLVAHGSPVPEGGVNPSNASSVSIRP